MNLQNPKKFKMLIDQAHEVALNVLRPISRKYDKAEHDYPKELDMLSALVDGMNEGSDGMNAGAAVNKRGDTDSGNKNGINMSTVSEYSELPEYDAVDTNILLVENKNNIELHFNAKYYKEKSRYYR